MDEQHVPSFDPKPPRLAVDANGYVWRVYETHWSMCPVNPDNEPIPQPVTFYEPVEALEAARELLAQVDLLLNGDLADSRNIIVAADRFRVAAASSAGGAGG